MFTKQGNKSVNAFAAQFLDMAQFCPEYLSSDSLLKEHFHRMLRKDLRQYIHLTQVDSFEKLIDLARGVEVEQTQHDDEPPKRKFDSIQYVSPTKKQKTSGTFSGSPVKPNTPLCKKCGRNHFGECKVGRVGCYNCGKQGHLSKDCKAYVNTTAIVCFYCHKEGHKKSNCPLLTEEERKAEIRKEVEKKISQTVGNQKGRSFQITADEAREAPDVVAGTFLVNDIPAKVLFDSGANKSFVSTKFSHHITKPLTKLANPLEVEIADSKVVVVRDVYLGCEIEIDVNFFKADMIPMVMREFDIVLGMDWLT